MYHTRGWWKMSIAIQIPDGLAEVINPDKNSEQGQIISQAIQICAKGEKLKILKDEYRIPGGWIHSNYCKEN